MADINSKPTAASGDSINIDGVLINSTVIIKSQVEGYAEGVGELKEILLDIQKTVASGTEVKDIENLQPEAGDPPYLGLQYFDEKDAGHFFGREKLTARIVNRLGATQFLAIIGASGSGKSSLARAGVLPALRRGQTLEDGTQPPSGSLHWEYYLITPTDHPLESLAAALLRGDPSPGAVAALAQEMRQNQRTFVLKARQLLAQSGSRRIFLLIDQFEEAFNLCRDKEEQSSFFKNLLAAVNPQESSPISILLTLRSDFYDPVAGTEGLRELVSQNQELIGPMDREELTRAVLFPAALGGWKIQQGLIQVMLDDVGREPGNLPLLSHALLETWLRRRGRTMTLSGYTDSGGVEGAIAQTAETVFQQRLTPQQRGIARLIFIRLAEIGENDLDTRRRAAFSELITRSTDKKTIEVVLDILTDSRLVTTDVIQPGDVRTVQVAHEALIRGWPTLQEWLHENRGGLLLHRELADATSDWLRRGRDPSLLFRGSRLREVKTWAAGNEDLLSLDENAFLEASQRSEVSQRLTRWAFAGSSAMLLIIIVLGVLWYQGIFSPPARMEGVYNIAVAPISIQAAGGSYGGSTQQTTEQISSWLAGYLSEELNDPNLWVWHNNPDLKRKHVIIDALPWSDPAAQENAARQTAETLEAQMVVFGNIDTSQTPPQLTLQFWISPTLGYRYEDLQGNFQSGGPIRVLDPTDPGLEVQSQLKEQAVSMARLALGLYHTQLGQAEQALQDYQRAAQAAPLSAMTQFFLGRENLFLVMRQDDPDQAQAYEVAAQQAFLRAVCLDPRYARAYIGLGSVSLGRAQRLLNDDAGNPPAPQVFELLDQAEQYYNQALKLSSGEMSGPVSTARIKEENCDDVNGTDPAAATNQLGLIPVAGVARNGLGAVQRLRGTAWMQAGELGQAAQAFDEAIRTYEGLVATFQETGQMRYLTQTYERLGIAYHSRARLDELSLDYDRARIDYEKAMVYYDLCIAQAQISPDLIVTQDIVDAHCRPYHQQVTERYQQLFAEGGS